MDENQMDENKIEQKQDWTKNFGPKPVGRKLGARSRDVNKSWALLGVTGKWIPFLKSFGQFSSKSAGIYPDFFMYFYVA